MNENTSPKLVNKIPELMAAHNLEKSDIIGAVAKAGYSAWVWGKLLKGETDFQTRTIHNVAKQLGVKFTDILDTE